MNGFLLLDKPSGISSFKAVERARRILGERKAGHCGTLDPLATGLLVISLGKATKLAQFITAQNKSYVAEIILGYNSTTYDRDGELTPVTSPEMITRAQVVDSLRRFSGEITQTAPIYSALKHNGKPLYHYARKNIPVQPKQRQVIIHSIELTSINLPQITISVTCSRGTYIRSIANDLGQMLGCGGYVNKLQRTSSGDYRLNEAITLEHLERLRELNQESEAIIPIDKMLKLPTVVLSDERAASVCNGSTICATDITINEKPISTQQLVALRNGANDMLAVGRMLFSDHQLEGLNGDRVIEYVRVL